jgi:sigma-B regulation protein RsbU (phosphoserine phosphatase)
MGDNAAGSAADRLRDLRAITDAALGRLDVDDLLVELLDRIRQIIDADTAAVLLLDVPSGDLVARAAQGLEEEVERGVRVPVGIGFAGRIALVKQPVLLDRVDSTTVANPILWEKGIRVMLGVPLLAEDGVVGVLHVGRLEDRSFTEHDAELLQVVAERVTGAILGRQAAVEQAAAHLLERSLLPERLPDLPGLEFAAHYLSPEDRMVGGDWYDTFTLPNGELWIVTADVAGHGLHAAVVVGRVRSVLRAYALEGGTPAEVLERVDRKVQHFEVGSMVTMVCAKLAPPFKELVFTVAGHPPPVIVDPSHPAQFLGDGSPDPPLGVLPGIERHSQRVSFPRQSVLFTYTDGLIERRGEDIDFGMDRLLRAVSSDHPEQVCQSVMRAMFQQPSEDDVALMAIRSV